MNLFQYLQELKRRNVIKAALAYIVVSWVILQVTAIVVPALGLSVLFLRAILYILIFAFPVWLLFTWFYEITPEGIKKTRDVKKEASIAPKTSMRLNYLIISAVGVAIILLGINAYMLYSRGPEGVVNSSEPETEKSVAVLAFANMSSEPDQEYFSDGISEEIMNMLARNQELKVMSRTSSFYFKGSKATVSEIGKQLKVNYLLEGSVRKAGDILRITAQLIDVNDGTHMWSETYDRKFEDIFGIQKDIATSVAKKMQVSILGEDEIILNSQAYEQYLKAKYLVNLYTSESQALAIKILEDVVEKFPDYAPAWAELSRAYIHAGLNFQNIPKMEAYNKALTAAHNAVRANPTYALGYLRLANIHNTGLQLDSARIYAHRAFELDPNNIEILRSMDMFMGHSIDEIIKTNLIVLEMDPFLYVTHFNLALFYSWQGENLKGLEQLNKYEELQPATEGAKSIKAIIYYQMDSLEQALKEANQETNIYWKQQILVPVYAALGRQAEADSVLALFLNHNPDNYSDIAIIYATMGEREKTFVYLEKALNSKDPSLTEAVYYYALRKFHDDPRWPKLLRDIGFKEDNGVPGFR